MRVRLREPVLLGLLVALGVLLAQSFADNLATALTYGITAAVGVWIYQGKPPSNGG
jgi:hypothetical protein